MNGSNSVWDDDAVVAALDRLRNARLNVGDLYVHYKALLGQKELTVYELTGLSLCANSLAVLVHYRDLRDGIPWVKPMAEFTETVMEPGSLYGSRKYRYVGHYNQRPVNEL